MEAVNVKMLKEGKRTIIIAEGAEEIRDEIAYRILSAYYGLEQGIPPLPDEPEAPEAPAAGESGGPAPVKRTPMPGLMEVKGLTPKVEEPVEAPSEEELAKMEAYASARQRDHRLIPEGEYQGMTPLGVLMRDREKALVSLFFLAKEMIDSPEKDEIIRACKQYMSNMPNMMKDYPDRESKLSCMLTLSKMGTLNACINGFRSLQDFCANASDEEVENSFRLAMYSYQERALRK